MNDPFSPEKFPVKGASIVDKIEDLRSQRDTHKRLAREYASRYKDVESRFHSAEAAALTVLIGALLGLAAAGVVVLL